MLVTKPFYVIEANNHGVQERTWNDALEGATLAIAMRRHSLLNAADQDKVIAAVKAF